jgi:hypothetical protein
MRVIALTGLFSSFPLDAALRGTQNNADLLRVAGLKALLTPPLLYLGMRAWGLHGAMASVAITELVGVTVLLLALRRAFGADAVRHLLPQRALLQRGGAAALSAFSVFAAMALLEMRLHPLPSLLLQAAVFAVLYLTLTRGLIAFEPRPYVLGPGGPA